MTIATVSIERRDALPVVRVLGDIDFPNSDAVRTDILATVPLDGPGMILDLTQTTYLDSGGIRLLFEVAERLRVRRQLLVLVASQEALIRRVIALTKLDDVVLLVATVDEALNILQDDV
ncbi:MAG: STAS domain-containing protein [Actinomycetota bacterium]|nr:STAS domain-containing protein [Actinomycetota bacterium]